MRSPFRGRGRRFGVLAAIGLAASALTVAPASAQAGAGHVTSNTQNTVAGSGRQPLYRGFTHDPMRYDCTLGGPDCQGVGVTHGWYSAPGSTRGTNVDFLYTARSYCDRAISSHAPTGCEAGAAAKKLPPGATSQDPLYIIVPLGFSPAGLQCYAPGRCIDHPGNMDLSRLASTLGKSPQSLYDAPLSPHDHIITNRNNNLPEWWNVNVIGVTSLASYNQIAASQGSMSVVKALESNKAAGVTAPVPTNVFLYFQTLAGRVRVQDAHLYHGVTGPTHFTPGVARNPLDRQCTTASTVGSSQICGQIGVTAGSVQGRKANFLYSENYFCDRRVPARSSSHCEAGAPATKLPPGTPSVSYTDPLYIIVPLFGKAGGLQCPTSGYCIDHPATTDLSRLASALGKSPQSLGNAPLSPHSHIVLTRNGAQPEWWNVKVIGVTSPSTYYQIARAKYQYSDVQRLRAQGNATVTPNIPTNIFLWFQVLPGSIR